MPAFCDARWTKIRGSGIRGHGCAIFFRGEFIVRRPRLYAIGLSRDNTVIWQLNAGQLSADNSMPENSMPRRLESEAEVNEDCSVRICIASRAASTGSTTIRYHQSPCVRSSITPHQMKPNSAVIRVYTDD